MQIVFVVTRVMVTMTNHGLEESLAKANSCGFVNHALMPTRTTNSVISVNKFMWKQEPMLILMVKNGFNVNIPIVENGSIQTVRY